MRTIILLLLAAAIATAGPVGLGLKAGTPLTNALKTRTGIESYIAGKQPYTIGPMVEVHLPARISFELDALYKPVDYRGTLAEGNPVTTSGGSWEFPLVLKYRFSDGLLRPYLGAGFSFRRLVGLKQLIEGDLDPRPPADEPLELDNRTTAGAVLEAGLEVKVLFLRISPEVRYTRWGSTSFRSALRGLVSNANQAEFLVGITF
jgi:hypothetical protein